MTTRNPVDHDILPVFQSRWSPYVFDPASPVDPADLAAVFEAARWAMSSYNEQPWRYIVGARGRGDDVHAQVLSVLVEGNRAWAQHAPVLALGLYLHDFEKSGKLNAAAQHDLGAASAFLTIEATSRGLVVHRMSGILPDEARETFQLPTTVVPLTALAIGYHGNNPELDEAIAKRDERERRRRPLSETIIAGAP